MAENSGYSRRIQSRVKATSPKQTAAPVIEYIPCDVDQTCDRAQYQVFVRLEDETKSLYFCGHHFRMLSLEFLERGYEVIKLLWVMLQRDIASSIRL